MGEMGWQDESQAPVASRLRDAVRSVIRPANLLPGVLLVAGWLAFIGWTGAGSDGWQARICADLAVQARSCGMVEGGLVQGGLVQGAGSAFPSASERSSS